MFELLKLLMDGLVLRDSARKGLLDWKVMLTGFGFVIFLYGTALPALLLYQRNPRYEWLFIATLCVDAGVFGLVMFFGARRYLRATAASKEPDSASQ